MSIHYQRAPNVLEYKGDNFFHHYRHAWGCAKSLEKKWNNPEDCIPKIMQKMCWNIEEILRSSRFYLLQKGATFTRFFLFRRLQLRPTMPYIQG